MSIYMRFENNKQVEMTTLENKPEGEGWYEAPENFNWQKRYCLAEGGNIVERSNEDIELELLQNAKFSALSDLRIHYDRCTHQYAGYSHQKAKSYEIQEKAAENILVSESSKLNEKDTQIIEPLAKVRDITIIEMAKLIQNKAQKAVKAIIKCEELEDLAERKFEAAKNEGELKALLNDFKQRIQEIGRG